MILIFEILEKVDGETRKRLYSQIFVKEVEKQNLKELAATYAEMEPANAAAIFNRDCQIRSCCDLIEAMKRDVKAEIIENMDPKFSAEILKLLLQEIVRLITTKHYCTIKVKN